MKKSWKQFRWRGWMKEDSQRLHHTSSADEAATGAIAARLARQCGAGDCILLNGDLGAGKTSFARGFIKALSPATTEVISPTFNLLQTYPTDAGQTIWHFDLYRLEAAEEVVEIGLDEALQSGITLIEWPDIAASELPPEALTVHIGIGAGADSHSRHFTFAGLASVWEKRLNTM